MPGTRLGMTVDKQQKKLRLAAELFRSLIAILIR